MPLNDAASTLFAQAEQQRESAIAEALAQERAIFQQKESEGRRRFEAELLRKDEALRDSEKLKLQIEEVGRKLFMLLTVLICAAQVQAGFHPGQHPGGSQSPGPLERRGQPAL